MNETEQLELFGDIQKPIIKAQKVEYLSPELRDIDEYAYAVCKALKGEHDPNYRNTDVVQGFSNFMRVVVKLKTNELNQRGDP